MADFKISCDYVLAHEDATLSGIVTPDPTKADPSAIARFGVNSASHPEAIRDGFYEMDRDAALQYAENEFKYNYFNMVGGYNIADQAICNKICDLAFVQGVGQAGKIAQRALGFTDKAVDGIIGSKTVAAINAADPVTLLAAIKQQATNFFNALAADNPQMQDNLAGWLRRVEC